MSTPKQTLPIVRSLPPVYLTYFDPNSPTKLRQVMAVPERQVVFYPQKDAQ